MSDAVIITEAENRQVVEADAGTQVVEQVLTTGGGTVDQSARDAAAAAQATADSKQDSATAATDAELTAHAADTTAIHGIANTAALATSADLAGYQPLDSDLTAIAALATTSYGRSLLALADAAAGRAALDVGATYLDVAMDDTPAGLWAHNETAGTTSTDLSGNGNHGTYTGGYTLNQTGGVNGLKATLLNGSSGYVTVPDAASLDFTTACTLEVWVNPATAGGTGERGGVSKGGATGYLLNLYQSGIVARTAGGGPTNVGLVTLDAWNLIAIEWDKVAVSAYLNGVLLSKTGQTNAITPGSAALLIGQSGGSNWLNGLIGPVAVYNHIIGPMRHARHWLAGVGT